MKQTTQPARQEFVNLPIKEIAEYMKCSPMLTKKKLEKRGIKITRTGGIAFAAIHAANPMVQYIQQLRARKVVEVERDQVAVAMTQLKETTHD